MRVKGAHKVDTPESVGLPLFKLQQAVPHVSQVEES